MQGRVGGDTVGGGDESAGSKQPAVGMRAVLTREDGRERKGGRGIRMCRLQLGIAGVLLVSSVLEV